MDNLIYIFAVLGCLIVLRLIKSLLKPSTPRADYILNKALFSEAERSFYGVLNQSLPDEMIVMGKVRVADILTPHKRLGKSKWQAAFNKIAYKHVDFILCDKHDLSILAAIELDDKSYRATKTKSRDAFLNDAFESANLPLIRFPAQRSYIPTAVREKILAALSTSLPTDPTVSMTASEVTR